MIAALFVEPGGVYYGLPDVDPWDEARGASVGTQTGPVSVQAGGIARYRQRRVRNE